MSFTQGDTAPARDGRVSRTALLGILAAGMGGNAFEDIASTSSTVVPFVLMMLMAGALIIELTDQARRHTSVENSWASTDTAIVTVLVVYASLFGTAAAVFNLPASDETASSSFAVLYVVLAASYWWVRRHTVSGSGE